jgi:predicted metal-dependent HD superfamily phosphohydrolase
MNEEKEWLRQCWSEVAPGNQGHVFDYLVEAYSESHRAYHTLEHVAHVLRVTREMDAGSPEQRLVELALWFHDCVYDSTARDNEERSVNAFLSYASSLELSGTEVASVFGAILATKHRRGQTLDLVAATVIDADLSVLGGTPWHFSVYCARVRQEYPHVHWTEYLPVRRRVLRSFLDRPAIYTTPHYRRAFEDRARSNITNELQFLE